MTAHPVGVEEEVMRWTAAVCALALCGPVAWAQDEGGTTPATGAQAPAAEAEPKWAHLDGISLRLGTNFWNREDKGGGLRSEADEIRFAAQLNAWLGFDQPIMLGGVLTYDFAYGFGGDVDFRGGGAGFAASADIEGISHIIDVGPSLPIRLRNVTLYPFVAYNFHVESLDTSSAVIGSQDETFTSHGFTAGARIAASLGVVGLELIGRYTRLLDGELDVSGAGLSVPALDTEGDMIRVDAAVWFYAIPDQLSISIGGGVMLKTIDESDPEQVGMFVVQSAEQEFLVGTVKVGLNLFF
jgi:hypothetical protein